MKYWYLNQLLVNKPLTHRNEGEELRLAGETPVLSGSFKAGNGWQEMKFGKPVSGRYVCIEALNAQDGKDLACIAEMYLLDENGERLSREPWVRRIRFSICRSLLTGVPKPVRLILIRS